jgi:glycosyltransferase involved in cell wall biosynthesis
MKNKKVCILTSAHFVFDTRIFQKQAISLVRNGYEVFLIAPHNKKEIVKGIKIIPVLQPKNRIERFLGVNFQLFFKALQLKADIYHFHDPDLLLVGLMIKLFGKGKIIYDIHDYYPDKILFKEWLVFNRLVAKFFKIFESFSCNFLDGLVVVSEGIAEKFPNQEVVIIKNYPLINLLKKHKKEDYLSKKPFIVVYTGGFTDRGLYGTVQALDYFERKEIKLKIFGGDSDQKFKNRIKNLKSFNKIEYCGLTSLSQLYNELSLADIGIVCKLPKAGRAETSIPNKLFEYMSVGLPVIASNFDHWKEIVIGNRCGVCVDPKRPEEITKAIVFLKNKPEERKKMGKRGRKAILNKYNWKKEELKLINLYKKIIFNENR